MAWAVTTGHRELAVTPKTPAWRGKAGRKGESGTGKRDGGRESGTGPILGKRDGRGKAGGKLDGSDIVNWAALPTSERSSTGRGEKAGRRGESAGRKRDEAGRGTKRDGDAGRSGTGPLLGNMGKQKSHLT